MSAATKTTYRCSFDEEVVLVLQESNGMSQAAPFTSPKKRAILQERDGAWLLARFTALRSNLQLLSGITLLSALVIVAVFAETIALADPIRVDLPNRLQPPNAENWFGTDALGRDVLSRVIFGTRVSMFVGFGTILFSGIIGVSIGLLAGYYGGWIEIVLMRLTDAQLAVPIVLLAVVVVAFAGPSMLNLILVLSVAGWVTYSRLVYGNTLSLKEREFILAARAIGATDRMIIFRHILRNTWSPIVVVSGFQTAQMILAEASLSFLGLGVQPPTPSLGGMLSEARDVLSVAPWIAIFPGVTIVITVFSINLVAEGLQEVLSRRKQKRGG